MDGRAVGATCYRDPVAAASAACSAVSGTSASGVVSCEAASVVDGVLTYTLNVDSAAGRVSRPVVVALPECEPFDVIELAPLIGAWVLALVVILSARALYTKTFGRET